MYCLSILKLFCGVHSSRVPSYIVIGMSPVWYNLLSSALDGDYPKAMLLSRYLLLQPPECGLLEMLAGLMVKVIYAYAPHPAYEYERMRLELNNWVQ